MIRLRTSLAERTLRLTVIVAALFFFVGYRFLTSFLLWDGRGLPPEPDDSFTYISAARDIYQQGDAIPDTVALPRTSSERLKSVPYSLTLVSIARLSDLSVATTYHLMFYLGGLMAGFLFFILLRYLFQDDLKAALSLLVLGFFNGHGAYHGFFWVVPSFFGFLAFSFLLYLLVAPHRWSTMLLLVVSPYFFLVHPMNTYAVGALIAFVVLSLFFTKRIDVVLLRKGALLFAATAVVLLGVKLFESVNHIGEGPTADVSSIVGNITTSRQFINPDSWQNFQSLYLRHFVPLPAITGHQFSQFLAQGLLLIIGLLVLVRRQEWRVLSIFGATLAFALITLASQFGTRALLYLWPVTFMVMSASLWVAIRSWFKHRIHRLLPILVAVLGLLFMYETLTDNYHVITAFNAKAKVAFNKPAVDFLRNQTVSRERILFADKFSETYFIRGGGLTDRAPIDWNVDWTKPEFANERVLSGVRFLIATDTTFQQTFFQQQINSFLRAYYRVTHHIDAPSIWYARHLIPVLDAGDTFAFGHLKIYRIGGEVTADDLKPLPMGTSR